ncbi:hypothetical protein Hanom_Chr08g00733171 [Helianthus anomalus]
MFSPIHNGLLTRARLQPNYGDTSTFWEAVVAVKKKGTGQFLVSYRLFNFDFFFHSLLFLAAV